MHQTLEAGTSRFSGERSGCLETPCAAVCARRVSCALEQLEKVCVDRPGSGDFSAAPTPAPIFANPDVRLIGTRKQPVEGWLRQGFCSLR